MQATKNKNTNKNKNKKKKKKKKKGKNNVNIILISRGGLHHQEWFQEGPLWKLKHLN